MRTPLTVRKSFRCCLAEGPRSPHDHRVGSPEGGPMMPTDPRSGVRPEAAPKHEAPRIRWSDDDVVPRGREPASAVRMSSEQQGNLTGAASCA